MPKFGKVRPKESEVMKRKPFHMKTASYFCGRIPLSVKMTKRTFPKMKKLRVAFAEKYRTRERGILFDFRRGERQGEVVM